ncbi:hypothetical protein BT96DRAFT_943518 [Gymnopus androsaceus JB14]|uniref:Uncharacterized protein n=1 Tax=Gymnopus androsaceus JB14 TaxID=1447944 RepID=A0A6A4H9U7_9AGAR|nr:hypothetical protein BT96DRAFT_943518 [Gymnopus androsaceus JB14]
MDLGTKILRQTESICHSYQIYCIQLVYWHVKIKTILGRCDQIWIDDVEGAKWMLTKGNWDVFMQYFNKEMDIDLPEKDTEVASKDIDLLVKAIPKSVLNIYLEHNPPLLHNSKQKSKKQIREVSQEFLSQKSARLVAYNNKEDVLENDDIGEDNNADDTGSEDKDEDDKGKNEQYGTRTNTIGSLLFVGRVTQWIKVWLRRNSLNMSRTAPSLYKLYVLDSPEVMLDKPPATNNKVAGISKKGLEHI